MSMTIQQTILIRASAARIFKALTTREDITAWWGQVNEHTNEDHVWPGRGGLSPITVRDATANASLHLALEQQHPNDESRAVPSLIRFQLEPYHGATLVHVFQFGIPDEDWRNDLREGWTWILYYLQSWVESGRSLAQLGVQGNFAVIRKQIEVPSDAAWCWQALTDTRLLEEWMDADVESSPVPGGGIDIRWRDGRHTGGEYVLLDQPRTFITHWWDADLLAREDDPGLITAMHWSITERGDGQSVITLTDTGYDRTRVSHECLDMIDQMWEVRMNHLSSLAGEHASGARTI